MSRISSRISRDISETSRTHVQSKMPVMIVGNRGAAAWKLPPPVSFTSEFAPPRTSQSTAFPHLHPHRSQARKPSCRVSRCVRSRAALAPLRVSTSSTTLQAPQSRRSLSELWVSGVFCNTRIAMCAHDPDSRACPPFIKACHTKRIVPNVQEKMVTGVEKLSAKLPGHHHNTGTVRTFRRISSRAIYRDRRLAQLRSRAARRRPRVAHGDSGTRGPG